MNIIKLIKRKYAEYKGGETYLGYLREKGCIIGNNCTIGPVNTVTIDITRPYLVEIGNNVCMLKGFTLLTHDFVTAVFITRYGEFLPSSGKVTIGNNVYFGRNCTVLKGVTIGDNCIIGYGSIVTQNIPPNSVAVGVPAKVICSLDEFYEKRKKKSLEEALALAKEIEYKFKRRPIAKDFFEEFGFFCSGNEIDKYPELPIKFQLTRNGGCLEQWIKEHKAPFHSFDDFLLAAGIK